MRRWDRLTAIFAGIALVVLWTWACPGSTAQRPNVVLILTDDQPYHTLDYMPIVNTRIGDEGARFDRYYVVTAMCASSCATILTGLYEHHHRVVSNGEGAADFALFANQTVGAWLHAAGYRTALIGKYENHYTVGAGGFPAVPAGWDEWVAFDGGYYGYDLSVNGTPVHKGTDLGDYSTYVLRDAALDFIASTPADQPLFLYWAPYAPHGPYDPAPEDAHAFDGVPWGAAQLPNYNETDISDKPAWVRALAPTNDGLMREKYERTLESLQAVDRSVGAILDALARAGRFNAYVIFTSDNGFSLGAHRYTGKWCPYEECSRQPMLVRGPGIPAGATIPASKLASNVDLAQTIAEMAGVTPPAARDGVSFLPLVQNPETPWARDLLLTDRWRGGKKRQYWAVRSADGCSTSSTATGTGSSTTSTPTPGSSRTSRGTRPTRLSRTASSPSSRGSDDPTDLLFKL